MDNNETKSVLPIISVEREGVTKLMVEGTFGKKSKNAGKKFLYPSFDDKNATDELKWWGIDSIASIVDVAGRRLGQQIFIANYDEETGEFDVEGFTEDMKDLAVSRITLSDIEESVDELQTKQEAIVNDPSFVDPDDANYNDNSKKLMADLKELNKKLKPLREQRAEIEAKYAVRAEKRKATKAANATKKKAAEAVVS